MYESNQTAVASTLSNSSPVFTDELIQTILGLSTTVSGGAVGIEQTTVPSSGFVTVPAGTDIAFVHGSDTIQTNVTLSNTAPVVVFQGAGGVNVIVNDASSGGGGDGHVDRVIVGTAGNDSIVIADGRDTQIVLGSGNSTVVAGSGDDTVVAGLGNATIDGGTGHAVVALGGSSSDYQVVITSQGTPGGGVPQAATTSHVVITNNVTHVTTDLTNVQYVQLDGGNAMILADSTTEASVAALYHAAFGRTGEAEGIEYWFQKVQSGRSLHEIAADFTNSAEFHAAAALSDTDFINALYQNTFGRAADAGGFAYWQNQLSHGATRADLLAAFANVAGQNEDGTLHTEATVVGTVTIVHNIV